MSASPDSLDTAITAAQAASDKLATDIVAIDVSEQLVITDVFVICSGANERQVKSIVDAIEEALHAKGVKPSLTPPMSLGCMNLLSRRRRPRIRPCV